MILFNGGWLRNLEWMYISFVLLWFSFKLLVSIYDEMLVRYCFKDCFDCVSCWLFLNDKYNWELLV